MQPGDYCDLQDVRDESSYDRIEMLSGSTTMPQVETNRSRSNLVGNEDNGRTETRTPTLPRRSRTDRKTIRKRPLLLVFLVLTVAILAVVTVALVLILKDKKQTEAGEEKFFTQAIVGLRIINRDFTSGLGDSGSAEFQQFSQDFCAEIDQIYMQSHLSGQYGECFVQRVHNGSLNVIFLAIFESQNLEKSDIIAPLKTLQNSNDEIKLGAFRVSINSIWVNLFQVRQENQPVAKTAPPATTTTTTPPPGEPALVCDAGAEVELGNDATLKCSLYNADQVTVIGIQQDSQANVSAQNDAGLMGEVVVGDFSVNIDTSSNPFQLAFRKTSTECSDEGTYLISANDLEESLELQVVSQPESPNLSIASNVFLNQETEVTCIGGVGRNGEGLAAAELGLFVQYNGSSDFEKVATAAPVSSSQDCQITHTVSASIFPTDTWRASTLKCVTTIASDPATPLESAPQTLDLLTPTISFGEVSPTVYLAGTAQLTCTATGQYSGLTITRKAANSDTEETVATISSGQSAQSMFMHVAVTDESSITDSKSILGIEIADVQCSDGGEYYCEATGGVRTFTTLTIHRKPEEPVLTLSRQIIDGQETWADRLFSCSAQVGVPPRSLVIKSNKDGSFETIQHGGEQKITDSGDCSNVATLDFWYTFTMEYDNTQLKCEVVPDDALGDCDVEWSTEKTVRVLPANFCDGKAQALIIHPYECHHYVHCNGGNLNGVGSCYQGCLVGQVCGDCSNAGCAETTTTTTTTTTSTTTLPPGPFIQFSSNVYEAWIDGEVTMTCSAQEVAGLTSLRILKLPEDTSQGAPAPLALVTVDGVAPSSTPGVTVSSTAFSSTGGDLSVTFAATQCQDEGQYFCAFNNDFGLMTPTTLVVKRKPGKPTLTPPRETVIGRITRSEYPFICSGEIGYPTPGELAIERLEGGQWSEETPDISSDTTTPGDCSNEGRSKFQFTPTAAWNGTSVRCVVKNSPDIPSGETPPSSSPMTVQLLPDDACDDPNQYARHPFDCWKYRICVGQAYIVQQCATGTCATDFRVDGDGNPVNPCVLCSGC